MGGGHQVHIVESQKREGNGIDKGKEGILPGGNARVCHAHDAGGHAEGGDAQAQKPEDPQQVLQEEGLAAEAHLAYLFPKGAAGGSAPEAAGEVVPEHRG